MRSAGEILDVERNKVMLDRGIGLTDLYDRVNDPDITDADADIARLRRIHVELDEAVMAAYGWQDVELDHGFHTYRQSKHSVIPSAELSRRDPQVRARGAR